MRTLAVISILALIAIGGAVYSDQVLTSQQATGAERSELKHLSKLILSGWYLGDTSNAFGGSIS